MTNADTPSSPNPPFKARYRNYRGEVSDRTIMPISVRYGATEWHPEPQWLLRAWDVDKGAEREFALSDFVDAGDSEPASTEAIEEAKDFCIMLMSSPPGLTLHMPTDEITRRLDDWYAGAAAKLVGFIERRISLAIGDRKPVARNTL